MMTKEISCPRPVEGEQLIYFCNLSFAISHVIVEVQDGGKLRSRDSVLISHSSSKLASLFGQDRASFLGGNESLTYTAPKQPKKEKPGERLINLCAVCGYNRINLVVISVYEVRGHFFALNQAIQVDLLRIPQKKETHENL